MANKDAVYWEKRIAKETWRTYNSLEERNRQLLEMYQDAARNISEELYKVAEKINVTGGITLSDMHKFNRLTKLRKNFEKTVQTLGEKTEDFARSNMKEGFLSTYKTASLAISDERFTVPNKKLMNEMLDRPWRGGSFSSRLWKNTGILTMNLNEDLVVGLQQGKTIAEISINLANKMQQGFNVAHRLIRTETMHYLNSAAARAYKDRGVTHIQIWAAEDERTCEHCMKYHSKVYPINKAPILPIHAYCRCTYLPVVDYGTIKAAESAPRNTFTVVEYNPKANYSVQLPSYSAPVNKGLSKVMEEVAKLGSKDRKEHLRLVDLKTGEHIFSDDAGDFGSIGGPEFWKFVDRNKDLNIAFVHNHNIDSYFSLTDMNTLLTCENIRAMIAVRNDGVKYVARKKESVTAITGSLYDVYEDNLSSLNQKVKDGIIPREDRTTEIEKMLVNNSIRDYIEEGVEFDGRTKE